ncbi:fumarylacetoacetate hydrolase family protein [Sphingomonas sp. AOB5]|uniref:fumarylacetoacetate hydrolase family protein n=1 Tax=Sphingomonas sp. AOB5 TaxID=3034017 RepID=UPI0023F84F08|nr:fumarylacetoacetate hydrolase family protein [Sphingomonas sp. AOB5]MDF7775560.1 fumarylacetoacetate hydrolase family protein [Sphingomonas sp. AOB5]
MLPAEMLPEDAARAVLVGRVWRGDRPWLVTVRNGRLLSLDGLADTMSELLDLPDVAAAVAAFDASPLDVTEADLLAPCDLQAIKAAGVTFADSMLERVVEERAGGDVAKAASIRAEIEALAGSTLAGVRPGSAEAAALREAMMAAGQWSQYLEVGLGPYAEIFTKAQPMSAVGWGAAVGLHPASQWNNPEPEMVLAVTSRGEIVGATLGNDVNLRDIEGRSALLLPMAKDNNASCAIGPFIRLFDAHFTLEDVRAADVSVEIAGEDGFRCKGVNSMARISRDPLDLVAQAYGRSHQYPDGFMLFCGTMYVPTDDRGASGQGFTHHLGDKVSIRSPRIGCLVNSVTRSDLAPPWTFGVGALLRAIQPKGREG